MSMHKTHAHMADLNEALKQHHLPHDKPSQLADCFRSGWLAHAAKDSDFAVVGYAKRAQFTIDAMCQIDPARRPAAQEGEVDIKSRVSELIAEHGTLRAAARSLNIDVGYLSRLEHGDKVHPSSETLAKIGLRDAGVKYQRLVFLPTQPAAQSEAQALAHNMMLWREDAVHNGNEYVPVHVRTLEKVIAQLRDMPAHQQATPKADPLNPGWCVGCNPDNCIGCGIGLNEAQATPEPDVAHLVASIKDDAKHAAYMAEIDNTDARDNYLHKLALSLDDLASRVHQQATPEPVGERWVVVRETALDVGRGNDVRTGGRPELGYALVSDAATFGSEGEAVAAIESANLPVGWVVLPLSRLLPDLEYTRPAPGVPEGFALVPMTEDQVWHNDSIMSANAIGGLKMDAVMRIVRGVEAHHSARLAAAQAKGS